MPLIPDWYCKWECIACGTRQQVYIGDPQNYNRADVDVMCCYKCDTYELLIDKEDFCYAYGLTDHDGVPIEVTQEMMREYGYIEIGERL